MKVFVSGHISLTEEEFNQHYKPKIDCHVLLGDQFVIGDCKGADEMSMRYLHERCYHKVTILHMFEFPRYNYGFETIGGFTTDLERDSYGTNNTDIDVLFVREGKKKSGTYKNVLRRLEKNNELK